MPEDNEIFVHQCDVCGATVECLGIYADFALENEWYISPFSDFCSVCKKSEYAARVIKAETALSLEMRAGQFARTS